MMTRRRRTTTKTKQRRTITSPSVATVPLALAFAATSNAFHLSSMRSGSSSIQSFAVSNKQYRNRINYMRQPSLSFISATATTTVTTTSTAALLQVMSGDVEDETNITNRHEFEVFMKRNKLRSWLKDYEPMAHLSDVELETLTQLMKERKLKKDDVLVHGGEEATEFFIVSDGTFESYEYDDDADNKKERVLFHYSPGDAVGAISFALEKDYLYSVKATSDEASVWRIDTKVFGRTLQGKSDSVQKSISSKYTSTDSAFATYLNQRNKYDAVASCHLFDDLTKNDKKRVAEKLKLVDQLSKGQILIKEGDQASNPDLHILQKGVFEAYKEAKPKEVIEKYFNKGYVGELSVLLNKPLFASVRVASKYAKIYTLSRNDLLEAVRESPLDKVAKEALAAFSYQGKSMFSPKNLYQIWCLRSLPKRKSVSPHSSFATISMGAALLMLFPHFAPKIKNGWRIFRFVVENPTDDHVRLLNVCNVGMFITMLGGWLRFPVKGQSVRKVGFATINIGQAWLTFVALSNLMGPGSGYLIDAWSWLGRAIIISSCIGTCLMTGSLYNLSLFGPKMSDQPFFENHWKAFLSTTVFNLSNFGQMYHILPMLESRAKFEAITYPLYDAAVGNGQCLLTFWKFMSNLYLSFGGFIATLQFEKKFSVRTCNLMLAGWAVLLLTDLYKIGFNVVLLSKSGSQPHVNVLSYLTGMMSKYSLDTAWFGSIALIMLYGTFQRFVKKREMTGLFKWKDMEPEAESIKFGRKWPSSLWKLTKSTWTFLN